MTVRMGKAAIVAALVPATLAVAASGASAKEIKKSYTWSSGTNTCNVQVKAWNVSGNASASNEALCAPSFILGGKFIGVWLRSPSGRIFTTSKPMTGQWGGYSGGGANVSAGSVEAGNYEACGFYRYTESGQTYGTTCTTGPLK